MVFSIFIGLGLRIDMQPGQVTVAPGAPLLADDGATALLADDGTTALLAA